MLFLLRYSIFICKYWNSLISFLFPLRMYETSCTCEILHRTPHVHCLNSGLDYHSSCVMDIFLPFGTQWFWALYLCMLDPADTYCAPFEPEETVQVYSPFSFNIISDKLNIWRKKKNLFIKVKHIIQRERQHELARGKKCNKQQCFDFAYIFEIGLLFYEANSSSVLFIHMNIL